MSELHFACPCGATLSLVDVDLADGRIRDLVTANATAFNDLHGAHADVVRATANLARWKAEATPLLELLDRCHDLVPEPHQARLGHSKAEAVERYLQHLSG